MSLKFVIKYSYLAELFLLGHILIKKNLKTVCEQEIVIQKNYQYFEQVFLIQSCVEVHKMHFCLYFSLTDKYEHYLRHWWTWFDESPLKAENYQSLLC